ncbi:reverse transcriptase-like protein [Alkalihalobacillus sp. AL-G]|uniref:reverse transcriptase-like protein n=1 Tax=Alkalihalobacillus sp. AL-G TaxID=2926399 RepID=UPI00272CCEA7|nr:reverse transcriptase-like protein [Alkalihalobacillus sp. AL-G]WLD94657.1 reverse transcriptase-like protein [Alkalihalobacillus sp. AL-G]
MNVRIEFTYKTPKGTVTTFSSGEMSAGDGILIAEDLERTGRTKSLTFVDSLENTWNMKELKKFLKGIETEPHNVTVYFDGGFDLESKKSGLGCAIYYDQSGKSFRLRKNAFIEELDTNNEAEYAALHLGLQELELLGVHHLPVKFIGDSQVVINQLKGEWPCFEEELSKWAERIESKLKQLGITPDYELVSRKRNKEADQLASQALKEIEITSASETSPEQ